MNTKTSKLPRRVIFRLSSRQRSIEPRLIWSISLNNADKHDGTRAKMSQIEMEKCYESPALPFLTWKAAWIDFRELFLLPCSL